jgi:hypothetical protein
MAMQYKLTLAELDALVQASQDYLAATITKCDSPEIREARTALIRAIVPAEIQCMIAKACVEITIKPNETVV